MSELMLSYDTQNLVDDFLSLSNFQRAWEKVADNQGSAGVDSETIAEFARQERSNLSQLRDAVANSTYQPSPCKQVLIPKSQGKWRELKIPTVRDRIVQQALLNVIAPIMETKFSPVSFAYRPNLSYINAVEKVADCRDLGYQWVLDADIVQFFDNIDHQRLLIELRKYVGNPGILCLVKAWISIGTLTDRGVLKSEKGIPQGAVISPILANIYLHEFDQIISASDLKLVRYADDFLVLARTQERIVKAFSEVEQVLNAMGLALHPEKTQLVNFERGFRFLGHGFLENAIFPVDSPKSVKPEREGNSVKKKLSYSERKAKTEAEVIQTSQVPVALNLAPFEIEESSARSIRNLWNQHMATIYLIEQPTTIYKEHQRFVIKSDNEQKLEIPIREVERILVFGNIQLTTPVITTCLEERIVVLFLNQTGQYKGHLWSYNSIHLNNELTQFEKRSDREFQFSVSQAIVRGKLMNSKQFLMRLNRKRKVSEVAKAIAGIDSDISALDSVNNLDSLRGYEGIGAARYFPAFGQLITNSAFKFSQRYRQPPTDPVNSLLSFGYTLLFNNVLSLIISEGLSPYLGNFHYGEDKKPYLAFDLMEEFRSPVVDSFVLKIINNSSIRPSDFDSVISNGGVYLNTSARRFFIEQFEKRMHEEVAHPDLQNSVGYRQAIHLQIRRYKRYLLSGVAYEPFLRTV